MTYLEAVNSVLRRLREREVSSVSDNAYSKLIGDFVNDAMSEVENSWNWSALRTTMTVTTTPGIFNYVLTDSRNNFTVIDAINDTSNTFITYRPGNEFDALFLIPTNVPNGSPLYYNWNGVDASGDTQVDLFPVPNDVYTLRFNVVLRNLALSNDTDTFKIPHKPVILLALARAIEERGEDGGNSSQYAYGSGMRALADEIAFDAARRPEDTIWYTV